VLLSIIIVIKSNLGFSETNEKIYGKTIGNFLSLIEIIA